MHARQLMDEHDMQPRGFRNRLNIKAVTRTVSVAPVMAILLVTPLLVMPMPLWAQQTSSTTDPPTVDPLSTAPINPDASLPDIDSIDPNGADVPWPDLNEPLPKLTPLPDVPIADMSPPSPLSVPSKGKNTSPVEDVVRFPGNTSTPTPGVATPAPVDVVDAPMPDDVAPDATTRYGFALVSKAPHPGSKIEERFQTLSVLGLYDDKRANAAQIDRRTREDTQLLDQLARIEGYYDADVLTNVRREPDAIMVDFSLRAGPRYTYSAVNLIGIDAAGADAARLRPYFPLSVGDAVDADVLKAGQLKLATEMLESGYPFSTIGQELVTIDHATRHGVLDQPVTPGDRLRFGKIIVDDNRMFGARHIQRIARFDPGDWYQQSKVEDLRKALIATGLVSSVTLKPQAITPGDGAPGTVDLAVTARPGPMRTVAGEVGYGTGEGFRAEVSWTHRNFLPPEGALIVRAVVGQYEQLGGLTFRRNNFMRRDHVLVAEALASHVKRQGYDARSGLFRLNLERVTTLIYQKQWAWSVGGEIIWSDERSFDTNGVPTARAAYYIGALPGRIAYDSSDDLLDPHRGFRASLFVSPEISLRKGASLYARMQADASVYHPLGDRLVVAARGRIGSIEGAESENIAPSRRMYAGGGGSVRGYGYQSIGARDINRKPLGGRSLVEFSIEGRYRLPVWDNLLSVVPFVDVGTVGPSSTPSFSNMQFGAGVGIRYHSPFGPLRVDLATPINRRPGDSWIAVYVSLGQAF